MAKSLPGVNKPPAGLSPVLMGSDAAHLTEPKAAKPPRPTRSPTYRGAWDPKWTREPMKRNFRFCSLQGKDRVEAICLGHELDSALQRRLVSAFRNHYPGSLVDVVSTD